MKPSPVIKRSIVIDGHKTSVSLEDAFWNALKDIAHERRVTLSQLLAGINTNRRQDTPEVRGVLEGLGSRLVLGYTPSSA